MIQNFWKNLNFTASIRYYFFNVIKKTLPWLLCYLSQDMYIDTDINKLTITMLVFQFAPPTVNLIQNCSLWCVVSWLVAICPTFDDDSTLTLTFDGLHTQTLSQVYVD